MMEHVPEERLALYVGGDLNTADIREHLERCADCRANAAELEQTCSMIGSLGDEPAHEDLAEVRRRVRSRLQRRYATHIWGWSAAATAAAAIALICFVEHPAARVLPPAPLAPQVAAIPAVPKQRHPVRVKHHMSRPPAPGIKSVALLAQRDGPPLIKIATTDPHVLILLASDERTRTE